MLEYIEVVWKSKTNGNVDSMVFINLSFPNQSEKERERGKGGVVIKKRSLFLLGSSFVSQVNSTPFIIWLTAQRYFILSSWKDLFLKLHFITVQSAQCRQVNQVYFIKSNRLIFHNSIVSFQFSLMSNTTSFLSEFKFFLRHQIKPM